MRSAILLLLLLSSSLPSGIIHLRQLSQLILNDVSLAELPKEIGRSD